MREIGRRQGHESITDFARHMRQHPGQGPDEYVDRRVREHMLRNHRSLDAHLPVFAPCAFIIYLKCPWRVCAERRAAQKGRPVGAVLAELMQRDTDDQAKYAEIYPGSAWLESDYDFVVDTNSHDEGRTFMLVLAHWRLWSERMRERIISANFIPVVTPEAAPVQ
jgi:cytidylate kinase